MSDAGEMEYRIRSEFKISADAEGEAIEKFERHADAGQLANERWSLISPSDSVLKVSDRRE